MTTHNTPKWLLYPGRDNQRGATLIVSLIMLVVLTLLAVSGIRSSSVNLRIAGNMQVQEEAATVAQSVIEQVVSNNNFTTTPPAQQTVDINNDGIPDYTVVTTRACLSSKPALITEVIPDECFGSGGPYCYWSGWDIFSVATDNKTGAAATIHQGIKVLIGKQSALMNCGVI